MNTHNTFFGMYQNTIGGSIPQLNHTAYENIFKIGIDGVHPYYNILKTITIPTDLNDDLFIVITPLPNDTWTNLSYLYYDTIDLWWLIAITNNVFNPFKIPSTLKILKPEFVEDVLDIIKSQLN